MFDLEGRIIYANQIWRDIMGHAESDDVPFGWQSGMVIQRTFYAISANVKKFSIRHKSKK